MWNESDDQWPGTLTDGVPFTAEIVRDWMDKETSLMRLVVEDRANNSIVGFGSLWETPGREDSCCVDLLNVHPAHQKRSLARRMLTQMVDWATEHGYTRLTIETWPGNLKSVPLYKKVGFFWSPDTNVYMENYVPTLRLLGSAQGFFERHDWYATYKRELNQAEDELRHPATGGMKVYTLRWENDGEFLEAVVDRNAQALTGLETADFAAHAVVGEGEPVQGIAYPVQWRVRNKRGEPVSVSVLAEGEPGVALSHRASFELAAGEECTVEATFTCAVDAPRLVRNPEKPTPKIKTTLVIGGEAIELGTGLRYRPAVEISAEPEFPSLLPGRSEMILVQLRNRAKRPLTGTVSIAPQDGLTADWSSCEFDVGPDGYAGLPLQVTCSRAGSVALDVAATFFDKDQQVSTAPQRIPLLITPLGGVSASHIEDKIVIENDFFQLICKAKSGECRGYGKARQRRDFGFQEELGPPFAPWDLDQRQYDLALEQDHGWAKATMTVESGRFPGLTLVREITVTASPLARVEYRLANDGKVTRTVQINPLIKLLDKDISTVALPRKERLVVEHASYFPTAEEDMPKKPDLMAEQWMAFSREGQATGAIWSEDIAKHEFWWQRLHLYLAEREIRPQSAVNVGPLYIYSGPGGWQDVRRAWRRTNEVEGQPEKKPGRPHGFRLEPSPLLTLSGQVEAKLCADTVRKRATEGRITVEPPAGWTADRVEFPVKGLLAEKPLAETLRLTAADDRVGAFGGQLKFESQQFDEMRRFAVIRLGDENASVQAEENEDEGTPMWTIVNGSCAWAVTPSYHGGITVWREAHGEVNHLMTPYPDNGEIGWLKPWFGGIWPIINPLDDDQGWPGKLHEETFTAEPIVVVDAHGLSWRGVQVATTMKREGYEGLRVEVAYLTVGGSNVLKTIYRVTNETSVHRRHRLGLLAWCQPDEKYQNTVLYGDGLQYKRTPQNRFGKVGPWGAAVNPETGRTLVHVLASGEKRMELGDWGPDGGHLFAYNTASLPPHGTHEMVTYLALVDSLDEAKRYASLAK
jgi:GNAT superfamily N-acetyltransferase